MCEGEKIWRNKYLNSLGENPCKSQHKKEKQALLFSFKIQTKW